MVLSQQHSQSTREPDKLTKAEMNRDSIWSVNEFTKLPGRKRKRIVIKTVFITKRQRFKKKKARPMPINHRDL